MKKLNPDSGAFRRLQDIINSSGATRLKDLKDDGMRVYQIEVLLDYGYIMGMGGRVTVTQAGRDYVQEVLRDRGELAEVVAAQVKDEQVSRPYASIRSTVGARPYRPGADDYRNIPSLMGETRRLPSGEVIE